MTSVMPVSLASSHALAEYFTKSGRNAPMMVRSTSLRRCSMLPRRASRVRRRSSASSRSACMHQHTITGPRSFTQVTRTDMWSLSLSRSVAGAIKGGVRRVGGFALPSCYLARETRSSSRSGRMSLRWRLPVPSTCAGMPSPWTVEVCAQTL